MNPYCCYQKSFSSRFFPVACIYYTSIPSVILNTLTRMSHYTPLATLCTTATTAATTITSVVPTISDTTAEH
jgi:hypothetical protein